MEHNPEVEHCLSRPLKRHKASSSQTAREITRNNASDRAYDVFLSFRGPDSRYTTADVLYRSLTNAGFRVFLDDEEIRKGEVIEGELLAAITNSSIYIPIFSKDYASSRWCLRELAKMIDFWETPSSSDTKKVILPKDVKLRSRMYSTALQKHKDELGEHIVKPWEDALRKVTTIKGWNLKDHGLTELADLISNEVFSKVNATEAGTTLPDRLIGIDKPAARIMELLEEGSPGVRFVVIHGMGGIGKTTLADAVFKKISSHYQSSCFLKDVRRSTSIDDMVKLQKKLLLDILNLNNIKISNIDDGISTISKRLRNKDVLIVLDDVDKRDHLLKLAAKSFWFGPKSRIIITTRTTEFLPTEGDKEYYFHEMEKMESCHALQLFCQHAFEKDKPPHDFHGISTEIVDTTGRLPLSLQVIGSSLFNQDADRWKFTLMKLKEAPHKDVQKSLMISYQALEHEQQEIFLDIACLFNNMEMTNPNYFWEACKPYPHCHIKILVRRSLIKVSDDGRLWMHDQLRDFGRAIAQPKKSCLESQFPIKTSRLWSSERALDALQNQEVAQSIIAITGRALGANYQFVPEEFARANNLKFLEVNGGSFKGDFENLFHELRWLSWHKCPLKLEATNLSFKNLVVLKITFANINENWGGWSAFMESKLLKVLHIESCEGLKKIPNFSTLMQLERLILKDCSILEEIDLSTNKLEHLKCLEISNEFMMLFDDASLPAQPLLIQGFIGDLESIEVMRIFNAGLEELHPSIGKLKWLVELDLSCTEIIELPDSIGDLKRLKILRMERTPIEYPPDTIRGLESLEELHLAYSWIDYLPVTIGKLKRLKVIDVSCTEIKKLPEALVKLENLERLDAHSCRHMDGILPEEIGQLSNLRILNLEDVAISRLPTTISQLCHLQQLHLHGIHEPQELLQLPTSLKKLFVISSSLEFHRVPDLSNMTNLVDLSLQNGSDNDLHRTLSPCNQSPQMKWLASLTKLENLHLDLPNLISPPTELSCLSCLRSLGISCHDLQSLAHLPSSLDKLCLKYVESPIDWQFLSSFNNLSTLELHNCRFKEIKVDCYKHLHVLCLSNWDFLETLSGLSCLKELQVLKIKSCPLLVDIEGLRELKSLQELELRSCHSIQRLPDLSRLGKLEELNLFNCKCLKRIPDINEEAACRLEIDNCDHLRNFVGFHFKYDDVIEHECSGEGTGSHFEGSSETEDAGRNLEASSHISSPQRGICFENRSGSFSK